MAYPSRVYVAGKLAWSGSVESVFAKPVMSTDQAAETAFRSANRTVNRTVPSKPLPVYQGARHE